MNKVYRTRQSNVYHTSKECEALNHKREKRIQPMRKEIVEAWDQYRICTHCSGEWEELNRQAHAND